MGTVLELYEVKIRKPGDRITSAGKKVEGGKIVSRHWFRKDAQQAKDEGEGLGIGHVVAVHRVHKEDIIGDLVNNKGIRALITKRVDYNKQQVREVKKDLQAENDIMVQDISLSSVVFSGGNSPESKERRSRRLAFTMKHELKKEAEER